MEEVRTSSSLLWHLVLGFSRGAAADLCLAMCVVQSCFVLKVMLVSWQGHCRLLSISVIWSAIAEGRMCWQICLSTESEHLFDESTIE
jgi:hypothetical protein